jgi:hypothetical protein
MAKVYRSYQPEQNFLLPPSPREWPKREISEGGMTSWEEQQKVRRWAAQLYFIASQEMLHLALVWNLTTAIGGTPYYMRPNFPQDSKYYPINIPIELEPFGSRSLRRFTLYEHPQEMSDTNDLRILLASARRG